MTNIFTLLALFRDREKKVSKILMTGDSFAIWSHPYKLGSCLSTEREEGRWRERESEILVSKINELRKRSGKGRGTVVTF